MEAVQASVRVSAVGSAVAGGELGVAASSSSSSSRQTSARALLSRKPLSCRGVSTSSTSVSSFSYNALASKVSVAGEGKGHRGVVTMGKDSVAGGYASALADLAQATDNLEGINKDIESLEQILKNPEVYQYLISPIVEDDQKKSILKTLADDAQFNEYTLNFLYVLIDKKRFKIIKDVLKEFTLIFYELSETQLATVSSAVKIEKAQLALIAKKIQTLSGAKNVRIKNVIDTSLIAGFIVKYGKDGSRFVDMSVKGQLDRLAAQFEYAEKAEVS